MAFLAAARITYGSVTSYLSAIRHLHIMSGHPDHSMTVFLHLEYALKGLRLTGVVRPLLPITSTLLRRIHAVWSSSPLSLDRFMLWEAFCLGLFRILQACEFTCPSQSTISRMISVNDVSVDSHEAISHVMICVKCSNTDSFDTSFILHVGHTRDELCPVAAMLSYLAQRPPDPGFLFLSMMARLCHGIVFVEN